MARTDEAITKIRELIVSGELAPGARLPPENQLCAVLGVSRGTMREAVKALEVARVLDVRRGDGTYVTSLEPRMLLQGIGFAVQLLRDDDLGDVMHVRRVLEAEATALAAVSPDAELVDGLRDDLDRMRAAVAKFDTEELVVHDAAFHDRVASACGNQTLASLLAGLSHQTLRARIWRGTRERRAAELTIAQHEAILEAVADGDVLAARAASTLHVLTSERWLRQMLSGEPHPSGGSPDEAASRPEAAAGQPSRLRS